MKENIPEPPYLAQRFLAWFCPPSLYEGIEGDLQESFEEDAARLGEKRARRKYTWSVIRFFRPGIFLRNRFSYQIINTIMIGNYLKVASRNIVKRKLYSFINAFGLSVAIAFCTLIILFIRDEASFDRFQHDAERIYRVHATLFDGGKYEKGDPHPFRSHPYLPAKLGEVMLDEVAEVEAMTRFTNYNEGILRQGDKSFNQKFACVDSGFFSVFSFRILAGDYVNPLRSVSGAVLTQELAEKIFGSEDPIGKTFTLETDGTNKDMIVTAIVEAPPANSSVVFEMLVSMEVQPWFAQSRNNWGNSSYPTFVKVRPGTDVALLHTHIDGLVTKYLSKQKESMREHSKIPAAINPLKYEVMPLTDIHLHKEVYWDKVSDPQYSWILGGIALLILVIACINYISLALTSSASRRIEVGIRKVVGAQKNQIAWQFTFESLLLAMGSMVIGLVLVIFFLPYFNEFTGKQIALTLQNVAGMTGVSIVLSTLIGLVAGSYPSLFLSRFLPAAVLKGRFTSKLQAAFTKPLVVFQFFLSASMIICSVVMYRQMMYITTKDLGFDKEQVIVIPMQVGWSEKADQSYEQFRNSLKEKPFVTSVAGVTSSFNKGWSRYGFKVKDEFKNAFIYGVNPDFIPLMNIKLVAGRNFDNRPSDKKAVIVNEALVKDMGWTDPLSEHLNWEGDTLSMGSEVIGVVKDYHITSLEHEVEPMLLSMDYGYMITAMVKVTPGEVPDKMAELKKTWLTLFPDRPFEYTFVDEDIASQYDAYRRWSKIMGLSTVFAILIACLGLFGLAGINAVNRTKEIGIRKVMGAPIGSIFILLNRQYVWLALIAFALAAPLSWYAMNKWLQSFKFSITLGWELFAFSMMAGLLIALLTVSYHAIKTAWLNPADTLKYE